MGKTVNEEQLTLDTGAALAAPRMKNLANCKPTEFMVQANKIRKSVEKWLTVTEIREIRSKQPQLETVPMGASDEERERIFKANKERQMEQARQNISDMLDSIMEKHPQETLEILALASFIDPKDIDDYSISDYLGSFNEILENKNVVRFFTSLMSMGRASGLTLN